MEDFDKAVAEAKKEETLLLLVRRGDFTCKNLDFVKQTVAGSPAPPSAGPSQEGPPEPFGKLRINSAQALCATRASWACGLSMTPRLLSVASAFS
jgi:hypothetical protein